MSPTCRADVDLAQTDVLQLKNEAFWFVSELTQLVSHKSKFFPLLLI